MLGTKWICRRVRDSEALALAALSYFDGDADMRTHFSSCLYWELEETAGLPRS